MNATEETGLLEAELERCKQDLQEDLLLIETKLHRTRVRFRPAHFIGEKALFAVCASLLLGFVLAYWDIPFEDIGKPVARTMLTTVGRQMAVRALRG
jgi:hypothetical protein